MRIRNTILACACGFSLVEVIIVITVASVLFSMMYAFMGSTIHDAARPVIQLNQTFELSQVAERITAHYKTDSTADLNMLKTNLTNNPSQYGQNFSIITNAFVKFSGNNDTTIVGGDPENVLKVKIRQDQTNETITLLFTQQ